MEFKFKTGSFITGNAQEYGEELERIRIRHGGDIRPEQVVDEARSRKNSLHVYFEWNDNIAADKYRLWQARHLISCIVYIPDETENEEPIRYYANIQSGEDGKTYRCLPDILSDEEMCARLLKQALMELRHFKKKYSQLKELAEVMRVIRKVA